MSLVQVRGEEWQVERTSASLNLGRKPIDKMMMMMMIQLAVSFLNDRGCRITTWIESDHVKGRSRMLGSERESDRGCMAEVSMAMGSSFGLELLNRCSNVAEMWVELVFSYCFSLMTFLIGSIVRSSHSLTGSHPHQLKTQVRGLIVTQVTQIICDVSRRSCISLDISSEATKPSCRYSLFLLVSHCFTHWLGF